MGYLLESSPKHKFDEEIRKKDLFLPINLRIKYSVQQLINFNGNVFGNKCCQCNEGSLYFDQKYIIIHDLSWSCISDPLVTNLAFPLKWMISNSCYITIIYTVFKQLTQKADAIYTASHQCRCNVMTPLNIHRVPTGKFLTVWHEKPVPEVIKIFFVLILAEHDFFSANKNENANNISREKFMLS